VLIKKAILNDKLIIRAGGFKIIKNFINLILYSLLFKNYLFDSVERYNIYEKYKYFSIKHTK
jgi:hypothetical protein